MSTKAYDSALNFMPAEGKKEGLFTRFRAYMAALHDGLDAWREYERLRVSGVEHHIAAAKSFEKHFRA